MADEGYYDLLGVGFLGRGASIFFAARYLFKNFDLLRVNINSVQRFCSIYNVYILKCFMSLRSPPSPYFSKTPGHY